MSHEAGSEDESSPETATTIFRNQWSLYDKLLVGNHMRHREVYGEVHHELAARFREPFSLIDLGCGDASRAAMALQGTAIRKYVGVELVPALTDAARRHLSSLGCEVDFLVTDLGTVFSQPAPEPFDVILAGYSVHHLREAEKRQLLAGIHSWLSPTGQFLLIDLLCREDETRRHYLDRFHNIAATTFHGLDDEDKRQVRDHMEANDWPESQGRLDQFAASVGLTRSKLLYRDPEELYAVLSFNKA